MSWMLSSIAAQWVELVSGPFDVEPSSHKYGNFSKACGELRTERCCNFWIDCRLGGPMAPCSSSLNALW